MVNSSLREESLSQQEEALPSSQDAPREQEASLDSKPVTLAAVDSTSATAGSPAVSTPTSSSSQQSPSERMSSTDAGNTSIQTATASNQPMASPSDTSSSRPGGSKDQDFLAASNDFSDSRTNTTREASRSISISSASSSAAAIDREERSTSSSSSMESSSSTLKKVQHIQKDELTVISISSASSSGRGGEEVDLEERSTSSSSSVASSSSSALKKVQHVDKDEESEFVIPDGGYGWVIVAASFIMHLFLLGILYSFGILYVELLEVFDGSAGETSLVGSVQQGLFAGTAVFVGQIIARYGCKRTAVAGAFVLATSLVLSSFATEIWHLIVTYGVIGGAAFQLCYSPCIVIIGQWFSERRGMASGIAVAGSGIGTLVFAPVVEYLIARVGWAWYVRIAGLMSGSVIFLCGQFLFKEPPNYHKAPKSVSKGIVDFSLLKNPILLLFAGTHVIAGFGYFTPVTHIVKYAEESVGVDSSQAALLITYFGIGSTLGRIVLGYLADKFSVVVMMCFSIFFAGLVQAVAPAYSTFGGFVFFAVSYGFLSGSFVALTPVIVAKYIGLAKFPQAFGLLNTFGTFGLFLGAPSAGWMRDDYGNYDAAFILGGSLMMISIVFDASIPWAVKRFDLYVAGDENKKADLVDSDEDEEADLEHSSSVSLEGGPHKVKQQLVKADSAQLEMSKAARASMSHSIFFNAAQVQNQAAQ